MVSGSLQPAPTEPSPLETARDAESASPPRRHSIDWRPILLESFFVVLGVVVALAANEWRQWVVDRRRAATALESIRDELTANRAAVVASVQYHVQLMDTLSAFRRTAGESGSVPDIRLFNRGFIHPARLLSTAWETAIETDAVRHMQHDDVLTLAGIYEEQRDYSTQSQQAGAVIYNQLYNEGTTGVTRNYLNLGSIISTFWYRECSLLRAYDKTLAAITDSATTGSAALPQRCQYSQRR